MKKVLLILLSILITSCAKMAESYGFYKLSDEEKITKLINDADTYIYAGKQGKEYKNELLSLSGGDKFSEEFKNKLLSCYDTNHVTFSKDEQCTVRSYLSEIKKINDENMELKKKEDAKKGYEALISKSINRGFEKDRNNYSYFCSQSYTFMSLVISDVIAEREYAYAKKTTMGSFNQKFPTQSEKSFQYKILQITPKQLQMMKDNFDKSLPYGVNMYNQDGLINQNKYLTECMYSPENYVFNYDKIFKK